MVSNSELLPVKEWGFTRGMGNLLRTEFSRWLTTRLWWTQALIWLLVTNGIVALTLWSPRPAGASIADGIELFCIFLSLFGSVGVIIRMQSTVVGEKQTGTAAWVLSKPVSRPAFILAKLLANAVVVAAIYVLLQGIVAYVQVSLNSGVWGSPVNLLAGLGMLFLYMLFFLSLTLMLGTLFRQRGPVVGLPLAVLFAQQFAMGIVPQTVNFVPWVLGIGVGESTRALAVEAIEGLPLHTVTPIIATAAWSVLFVAIAVWRFSREEL